MIEFDYATLEHRLRELAFLNSGVTHRADRCAPRRRQARGAASTRAALAAFVRYLDRAKQPLIDRADHDRAPSSDGIDVEVALWWNDSYHENVLCFTNNIPQRDGGTHLAGFRAALTRVDQQVRRRDAASPRRRRSTSPARTRARA